MMRTRVCGTLVGVLSALLAGGGAGVVGWIFWDLAGALVLAVIGTFWGGSVAPDLARQLCRWKSRLRSRR